MHSNWMRTVRNSSRLLGRAWSRGGAWSQGGGCLLLGGSGPGGVPALGGLVLGGVCSQGGGIPACTEVDPPPPREQNDRRV